MKSQPGYSAFAFLLGIAGACAAYGKELPVAQPAVWIQHDLIVQLQDLPKRYTCDDLWYKFHDVLLEIGARPDLRILAYRCDKALGKDARSPAVHLHFAVPQAVHGAQARWSDVQAVDSTVRIEPGQPPSLDGSDCELLRQMKSKLLPVLGDRVVAYRLACDALSNVRPGFSLSVEALTPADGSQVRVAARAGRGQ